MTAKFIRSVLVLLTAAAAVTLSSCATSEGFGRDLQKVGNKIENKSEQVQAGY